MTRQHTVRGPARALLCATLFLLTCWFSPLQASAQDDEPDSTTITWWVVGTGGIIDAVNDDGDSLSGTFGQTAIDSVSAEDTTYGKIIYLPSAGWSYPRTIANLGFWLPKAGIGSEEESVPASTGATSAFVLKNHPNPFTTRTTISYDLPAAGHIRLRLFDASGKLMRLLADGVQSAGTHTIEWDGHDETGARLTTGAYICTLELLSDAIMNAVETTGYRAIYLAK
jgi:hypothetical protein